jgi:hypothetical protein
MAHRHPLIAIPLSATSTPTLNAGLDKLDAEMAGLTRSLFDLTGQVEALPRALPEMLIEREKGG